MIKLATGRRDRSCQLREWGNENIEVLTPKEPTSLNFLNKFYGSQSQLIYHCWVNAKARQANAKRFPVPSSVLERPIA